MSSPLIKIYGLTAGGKPSAIITYFGDSHVVKFGAVPAQLDAVGGKKE